MGRFLGHPLGHLVGEKRFLVRVVIGGGESTNVFFSVDGPVDGHSRSGSDILDRVWHLTNVHGGGGGL